ncbi:hypothetical protein GCM10027422_41800 [Hymenobacter arcticus]
MLAGAGGQVGGGVAIVQQQVMGVGREAVARAARVEHQYVAAGAAQRQRSTEAGVAAANNEYIKHEFW